MPMSPRPDDESLTRHRRRVTTVLVVAVALQLLVPLTYYLRDDPYDERFAWRMFSAIRVERCRATATEWRGDVEVPIDLARVVHAAWQQHIERHRRPVIERFLEARCATGVSRVRITNRCIDARGAPLAPRTYERACDTDVVHVGGAR